MVVQRTIGVEGFRFQESVSLLAFGGYWNGGASDSNCSALRELI